MTKPKRSALRRAEPRSRRTPRPPSRYFPPGRLVVGLQAVREAVEVHGPRLGALWLEAKETPRLSGLERYATAQGVRSVERRPRSDLDAASPKVVHQGVLCWAPELTLVPLNEVLTRDGLLAIALDGISDPQNFGATIRSAVAVADAPVLWAEHATAPLTPATFRASAGAIEHAQLCRVPSLAGALREAAQRGIHVVGLAPEAKAPFQDVDWSPPSIVVIGSEQDGMQRSVRRACTNLCRLEQGRRIASLNASVAAGIALYLAMISRAKSDT